MICNARINLNHYVAGGATSSLLPTGVSAFPFEVLLPPNLPASFNGPHGHIRYTAEAILKRSFKLNKSVTQEFRVCTSLDLNREPAVYRVGRATHCTLKFDSTLHAFRVTKSRVMLKKIERDAQ